MLLSHPRDSEIYFFLLNFSLSLSLSFLVPCLSLSLSLSLPLSPSIVALPAFARRGRALPPAVARSAGSRRDPSACARRPKKKPIGAGGGRAGFYVFNCVLLVVRA